MSRPPNIHRPIKLTTTIPENIRAQLDLHLWSTVEGRVPQGAYQTFLCDRIREFFLFKRFDTGLGIVQGPPAAIDLVRRLIIKQSEELV